jgi:DNA segregation ATPase FtsK/SpoIIIE, S-DNA-T family
LRSNKKEPNTFGLKLTSIILFLFSCIGILGGFGFGVGKPVFSHVSTIMGTHFAWIGLFFCLLISIVLWLFPAKSLSTQSRTSTKSGHSKAVAKAIHKVEGNRESSKPWLVSSKREEVGIPLPPGKLINLHGFNHYFSSPEWVEIKDVDQQLGDEMSELGNDFPTYFGAGETFFSKEPRKLTLLKGLETYFEDVDREEHVNYSNPKQENMISPLAGILKEKSKPPQFEPIFKSQTDQEEFLAQFKCGLDSAQEFTKEVNRETNEGHVGKEAEFKDKTETESEFKDRTESVFKEKPESESVIRDSERYLGGKSEINLETKPRELEYLEANSENLLEDPSPILNPVEDVIKEEPMPSVLEELDSESITEHQKILVSTTECDSKVIENHWDTPDLNLLDQVEQHPPVQDLETPKLLEKVLLDFGVKAKVIRVTRGPVITRYELAPAPGVKISKIVNLADDIALGLAARDVRIEAPIPGKAAIGIEVPNKQARSVPFREVLETATFQQYPSKLKVALGKDIADQPIVADLIKMPHLLVAGATGAGKSVCITSIINSILFNATPNEVKFLLVDPKMVELNLYNGIPHLLAPVVVDPKKAASALKWIVKEMENRYELFAASGVRDVDRYNKLKTGDSSKSSPALPYIVVIIDELADLMLVAPGEVEEAICRLAQMARAAGIHLVIATQRPSVDVITGVIKANIPSRISFAVSSQIDSRTILDATGAEKLLGRGDMLYSPLGVNKALRVQGCLVTDDEVQKVITHWKGLGKPEYLDPDRLFSETAEKPEEGNGPDDALFFEAGQLFIRTGMASVSFLQRRLKLGYTRAARLMDMLEEQGVVGAFEGSKPRQVLITMDEFLERFG